VFVLLLVIPGALAIVIAALWAGRTMAARRFPPSWTIEDKQTVR